MMDWLDTMPIKLDPSFNGSLPVFRLIMSLFQHESDTYSLIMKLNFKFNLFLLFNHKDFQALEKVRQRVCLISSLEVSKTYLNRDLSIPVWSQSWPCFKRGGWTRDLLSWIIVYAFLNYFFIIVGWCTTIL